MFGLKSIRHQIFYNSFRIDQLVVLRLQIKVAGESPYNRSRLVSCVKAPCGFIEVLLYMGNPNNAGMSGLIGDEEGKCIAGFHSYSGWTTSIMVEADSLEAVHLISGNSGPFHPCHALLEDINSLLNRSLFHTLREGKGRESMRRLSCQARVDLSGSQFCLGNSSFRSSYCFVRRWFG
ncbi:hypothetical protein POPTR_008G177350v4 [Populus trichocarpa]|jgi:hypothetical protein|uniref:Uncharacterized protein n=1 Tax=Populus trichocarpa TaxID=3694 RepID=A0A3N7GUX0_POPTR|nr:hypothetical protein POPTR_008G177350v4 [Populus trichocarpa]